MYWNPKALSWWIFGLPGAVPAGCWPLFWKKQEKELEGKVTVCKLDVDACPIAASKFSVMTIPTLVLFKDGKEVSREIGLMPKQKIIELTHRA